MRPRDLAALEFDQVRNRVADFARSPAGKEACLELDPTTDRAAVSRALDATYQCTRLIETAGDIPLGEFPDIRPSVRTASREGAVLDGLSLVQIRSVLDAGEAARAFLRKHVGTYPELAGLPERIVPLRELHATLRRALDDSGDVADEASDELADLRRELRHLRGRLQRKLEDLLNRPGFDELVSDRYVTLRNNRFVVPIKTVSAPQFDGVVQDRSVSGETTFIEPLFAVELNNRLIVAAKEEERLVRRILADLTDLVRNEDILLLTTFDALVEIDALGARARFSVHYRCTQPRLDDTEVRLHNARHPVLLFGSREVTAVDVLLPPDTRVLVITGPNTGGKTVALKTLGLMALMAQSGLLIPADEDSRLPCFGAIFADVGDEQSITRNLSTFSAHIANLTEILNSTEQPALVLLDEPGVGTDPEEGAALGIGIMQVLEARGTRVAVTTHYASIKVFALSHPACVTAAVEFDVDKLQPHYRLVYHSIGESLAIPIARRLGMPEAVLQAAEAARTEQARALAAAMSKLEDSRRTYEERLAETEARRAGATEAEREANRLLDELREKRRRRWAEELEEARSFLRQVRDQGRDMLARLERGEADRKELTRFVAEQEAAVQARLPEALPPQPVSSREPRVGDLVEVGQQGIRGELVALDGTRAWIQRGSMRFEVPSGGLRWVEGPQAAAKSVEVRVQRSDVDTATEISLVGLRAKEAVERLEQFLDHAVQAHHPRVRIIHGIGSGALRRAVGEYLSMSPYCSSYREGERGEGGAGVTVAELAVG